MILKSAGKLFAMIDGAEFGPVVTPRVKEVYLVVDVNDYYCDYDHLKRCNRVRK